MRVRTGTLCFGGGSICSDADFPFFGFPRNFRHLFGVGCFVTASIHHGVEARERGCLVGSIGPLLARGLWWNNNLRIFPTVNHWSSKSTGSFHFSQFSHADRRWTSDRKVHQINLGVSDVLLPAVVAGPTALKCVESDLADETNDLGPLRANGFQCALYARCSSPLFSCVTSIVGRSTRFTKFSAYFGMNFLS